MESTEFVWGEGGALELVVSARGQPHLTYVNVETLQQRQASKNNQRVMPVVKTNVMRKLKMIISLSSVEYEYDQAINRHKLSDADPSPPPSGDLSRCSRFVGGSAVCYSNKIASARQPPAEERRSEAAPVALAPSFSFSGLTFCHITLHSSPYLKLF